VHPGSELRFPRLWLTTDHADPGSPAMTLRVRALNEEEREALGRMARSRTTLGAGLVRRAQIVLHALEGLKAPEIGARMGLPHGPVRGDGAALAQALQRTRARRTEGRRAQRTTADLLRRAEECGHQRRPDPPGGSGPAVRLLDAGSPGRLPGRAEGHRHAPQPDGRDLHPGRPQVAAGRNLVRRAGRSGLCA
jgi:hypothetical protein